MNNLKNNNYSEKSNAIKEINDLFASNDIAEIMLRVNSNLSEPFDLKTKSKSAIRTPKKTNVALVSDMLKELIRVEEDSCDIDYITKFKERFKAKKMKYAPSDIKNKLQPWLANQQLPQGVYNKKSHMFILKICGVFDMSIDETKSFVSKVFFERAFYNDVDDIAAYYCIKNKIPCADWDRVFKFCNAELSESEKTGKNADNTDDSVLTSILYEQLSCISEEDELKRFISQNTETINSDHMKAARQEIEVLLKKSTEIAKKIKADNAIEEYDVIFGNKYKHEKSEQIVYCETIKRNFPTCKSLGRIRHNRGSYDSIRKTLILLHFFVFMSNSKNKSLCAKKCFEKYYFEANVLLARCGFSELFIRNPYEYLFMCCARAEDPLEMLRGCVSDMFGVQTGKDSLLLTKTTPDINLNFVLTVIYGFKLP